MSRWRLAFAALVALSLGACVNVTSPVGTTVGYVNDPALEGLWIGKADNADKDKPDTYIHVLLNDDKTMTVVGVTPRHGDDKAAWGTMTVTTAVLGGHRYMNVRETSEDGDAKAVDPAEGNIPLLYTLNGDTLTLLAFDSQKVEAAIAAHRIAGTVEKGNMTDTVSITADGAHLDALLARPDAPELFAPVMELHRVK